MAISITTGKRIDAAVAYLIALVSIILLTYPIIQFLLTSLKPTRGLFWSIWPESFTLRNYKLVVSSPYFRLALKNSIIIASFATFLVVGIGTLAAYALSSYVFSKREDIAFFILSLYILPPIVTIIPVWKMAIGIGVLDKWWFLGIVYSFFNLPLSVWILRNFFQAIPKELEDAARVDGCSRMSALFRIIMPLSTPGIAVAAIFSFIFSWNEFLFGVILTEVKARTLPVEIASQVAYYIQWGEISAMTILSILPVLVLSIFIQRYIVVGLTLGSVKQ